MLSRLAWPAFALACWFVGYFWFLGDLGKWRDDFWQSQYRPWLDVSRAWAWPWDVKQEFWRPLHFMLVTNMGTYWWELDWARHLVTAVACGVTAWLAWLMGRRLFASPHAAWGLGMGVLAMPLVQEIAFWPAAASTAIALGLFFVVCLASVSYGRRGRWSTLLLVALGVFCCACFNEQPVGGVLGLPLLVLAAALSRGAATALKTAVVRSAVASIAAGLGALAYVVPFALTRQPDARGGAETLAEPADVPANVAGALDRLLMESFGWQSRGVFSQGGRAGLDVLASPIGIAAGVLLVGLGVLAIWAAMRRPLVDQLQQSDRAVEQDEDTTANAGLSPALLVGFAALALLGMAIPSSLIEGGAAPTRVLYSMAAMMLVGGAAFADGWARLLAEAGSLAKLAATVGGVAIVAGSVLGTVTLLGLQRFNHDRAEFEREVIAELAAALPDPPPNAGYLCLGNAAQIVPEGVPMIERLQYGLLAHFFAIESAMRRLHGRDDLFGYAHHRFLRPVHRSLPDGMIRVRKVAAAAGRAAPERLAHNTLVFAVEPEGEVLVARGLWLESPDGDDSLVPTLGDGLDGALADTPPAFSLRFAEDYRLETPLTARVFGNWRENGVKPQPVPPMVAWNLRRPAFELEPGDVLARRIAPVDWPRTLVLRATLDEQDARDGNAMMELRVTLDGEVIASLLLAPEALLMDRRWLPIRVDLDGVREPGRLAVEVVPIGQGEPSRVLVDRGTVILGGGG